MPRGTEYKLEPKSSLFPSGSIAVGAAKALVRGQERMWALLLEDFQKLPGHGAGHLLNGGP